MTPDPQTDRFFVTGTDTGVGKTVLSLLMMQFFYDKGYCPFYLKPFQTGCRDPHDTDSDARFVYENIDALKGKDPAESVLYCFRRPRAPYFAARAEGAEADIDLEKVRNYVDEKARSFNPLILEGAGGLFVPVDSHTLMIDLIRLTASRPIVVARAGLGTINHTLLSLEALERKGMHPCGLFFVDAGDRAVPDDMIRENIDAVEKISGIKVTGVIEKIRDFSKPASTCYPFIEKIRS